MKFTDILTSAISNTFRSKLRTTLTIVAVFIGAFTLTLTSAVGTGVSRYINTQVAAMGATDVIIVSKADDAGAEGPAKYDPAAAKASSSMAGPPGSSMGMLAHSDLDEIAATSGVLHVEPVVLVAPDYIEFADQGKYELALNPNLGITQVDLAGGAQLDNPGNEPQILLPSTYLETLGMGSPDDIVGSTVGIGVTSHAGAQSSIQATVVGVQHETLLSGGSGINQNLTDKIKAIQDTGKPSNAVEGFIVATAYFDEALGTEHAQGIKDSLAAQGYTGQTIQDQLGTFQSVINGIVGVLNAFAVIALIAAGFGIINTLLMSVQERTREIGLMKAMGMGGGKVYALFSLEAIFIGFLGSAIGALAAIGLGSLLSNVLADTVLSDLPGLHIMQFDPGSVALIIAVVMLIAFLAGTLPARRAARQNPIDALRYE